MDYRCPILLPLDSPAPDLPRLPSPPSFPPRPHLSTQEHQGPAPGQCLGGGMPWMEISGSPLRLGITPLLLAPTSHLLQELQLTRTRTTSHTAALSAGGSRPASPPRIYSGRGSTSHGGGSGSSGGGAAGSSGGGDLTPWPAPRRVPGSSSGGGARVHLPPARRLPPLVAAWLIPSAMGSAAADAGSSGGGALMGQAPPLPAACPVPIALGSAAGFSGEDWSHVAARVVEAEPLALMPPPVRQDVAQPAVVPLAGSQSLPVASSLPPSQAVLQARPLEQLAYGRATSLGGAAAPQAAVQLASGRALLSADAMMRGPSPPQGDRAQDTLASHPIEDLVGSEYEDSEVRVGLAGGQAGRQAGGIGCRYLLPNSWHSSPCECPCHISQGESADKLGEAGFSAPSPFSEVPDALLMDFVMGTAQLPPGCIQLQPSAGHLQMLQDLQGWKDNDDNDGGASDVSEEVRSELGGSRPRIPPPKKTVKP